MNEREHVRHMLEFRFRHDITSVIDEDWREFKALAAQPSVQEFCAYESRYTERDVNPGDGYGIDFLDFNPAAYEFNAPEAAQVLAGAADRLDDFLVTLVQTYRRRRGKPELGSTEDIKALTMHLERIFAGGLGKVYEYCNLAWPVRHHNNVNAVFERRRHISYLPLALILLGAQLKAGQTYDEISPEVLEPGLSNAEVDSLIDETLREACCTILRNEKMVVAKAADPAEKIFAHSMNCLRTLYFQGSEKSFQKTIFTFCYAFYRSDDWELPNLTPQHAKTLLSHDYSQFTASMSRALGCNFPPLTESEISSLWQKTFEYVYPLVQQGRDAEFTNPMIDKMVSTHAARQLVDAIADGRIKYSQIMRGMLQVRKQPLAGFEKAVPEQVGLEWEVLPIGIVPGAGGDSGPPRLNVQQQPPERAIDWRRIEALKQYLLEWGDGYFARSIATNLSDDRQYYVAVLRQRQPDGTVLEHAVADHPAYGNGLYMWRAERAYLRDMHDRNIGLTWRSVFCRERAVARSLGAKRFYHTKNLVWNVLDYLTCPADQLITHRYAVGRGAVRLARLARGEG